MKCFREKIRKKEIRKRMERRGVNEGQKERVKQKKEKVKMKMGKRKKKRKRNN